MLPVQLSNYSCRSKRRRGEGLRLGCTRYPHAAKSSFAQQPQERSNDPGGT